MNTTLCFIDTETDGVHSDRKPWEIALIRREPDGAQDQLSFFVEIDLRTADPFGLRVGRFYDRHPLGRWIADPDQDGYTYPRPGPLHGNLFSTEAAARLVAQWTHRAHIVGAVPNFDTEVFDRLLREHGLAPAWHYHLIDVENLAVGYLRGHDMSTQLPWKSDELMAGIGVEPPTEDERHTALGDARWAMRAYDAMTGGAS